MAEIHEDNIGARKHVRILRMRAQIERIPAILSLGHAILLKAVSYFLAEVPNQLKG